MLYILHTNLKNKKKIDKALTDIYGLGKHNASQVCDILGISTDLRLKQLSSLQIEQITQTITKNYNVGVEMKRFTLTNIQRFIKIGIYKGFRHLEGLPVHGQRTHGNSRTVRKLKKNLSLDTKKKM